MQPIGLATALLAVLAGVPLLRAQPPGSPQETRPPVFKAGVELVRLDVRAVDDQGRPVRDLRADDLVVEEGGQRRPIVLFQHVAEPAGTYIEAARRTIGAEISTNQGAPRGHLYVFVFDQGHIAPGNEQRARAAVEQFLRTRVRPGDRVALYAIPGPGPQLGLSSNTNLALAQLPGIRGTLDRQVSVGVAPMSLFEAYTIARGDQGLAQRVATRTSEATAALDTARSAVTRPTQGGTGSGSLASNESFTAATQMVVDAARGIVANADGETRAFLMTLSDVIRELSAVEGRKSVILVSEGFFADNVTRDVDRVAAAAAEAYAVIYSLDINRRGTDLRATEPGGAEASAEIQGRLESLGALAAETSGELVLDAGERLAPALARVADSSQDYYVVGFEPPDGALADRHTYRRVRVRTSRPGVRLTTRTGYSLRDAVGAADRRRSIDAALAAPFTQQGLPLELTTYVLHGMSPGSQRVFLSLGADLPIAATDRSRPADVVFVVKDARSGRVLASGTDIMPLPRATPSGRTTAPGAFRVQFDLPAGEYLMRVVVREPGGATGTVDRRFEVRALDGVDVSASDLIVGSRQNRLPVRATAFVDEGLAGALEVYARGAADLSSADVTVDLFRVDADSPVRSAKAELAETRPVGSGHVRRARIEMPLEGVAPGEYVARASVRVRGEAVTEVVRQVQVVAGRAPAGVSGPAEEPVTPEMIVTGDLGQRFVKTLQAGGSGAVARAAGQAAGGEWNQVLVELGAPGVQDPAAAHALRGLALFALGRLDDAAASLEKARSAEADSALTAFFLGWVRAGQGRHSDAVSAWRAAVRLDPTLVSGYLALADVYLHLSHPELAAQALREGLRANPGSVELQARVDELERRH